MNNRKKTLLLVEDEFIIAMSQTQKLKKLGYDVVTAETGIKAVEIAAYNDKIDLILMDINMPLINGYDCTRLIKKERPALPVIAQTAYAMSGEREISREAGCDDYLSKPIKVSELLDTLSRYI